MVYDVTTRCTLALTYVRASALNRRYVANKADKDKLDKYADLSDRYQVRAIAFETMGPASDLTVALIKKIGRRIARITGDKRSGDFLLQRLSLAVQRGNAASVLGSIPRLQDTVYTHY